MDRLDKTCDQVFMFGSLSQVQLMADKSLSEVSVLPVKTGRSTGYVHCACL